MLRISRFVRINTFLFFLIGGALRAGDTSPIFQTELPLIGPFPADSLTTPDPNQLTGRRINFPAPAACALTPTLTACSDALLLNQLDGFSLNPRITVCFSDAISPDTLRTGIRFVPLGQRAQAIGVNQVLYDQASNCAFAKPDQVLKQRTRYVLAILDSVLDTNGHKTKTSKEFRDCLKGSTTYCADLAESLVSVQGSGQLTGNVVGASVFTTLSATSWLEKARALVRSGPPVALRAGSQVSWSTQGLNSMTWDPQGAAPQQIPVPADVDQIAFGLYLSPNFLQVQGPLAGSIAVTPTNAPIGAPVPVPGLPSNIPAGYVPVSFHIYLPPAPANGHPFPVAIYGHGLGDNQFGAPTYIASMLAKQGIATLAIEINGHGFGPGGYVQLNFTNKSPALIATPGRGLPLSPGNTYGPTDGCILPGPLAVRDCARQTAVDLFALVNTIKSGGLLGVPLDPSRIYYIGQSFGSTYGTLFNALETDVNKAVLNGMGGTSVDVSRLAISGRPLASFYLASMNPPLLNVPPALAEAYFHDNFNDEYVLRDQPVVLNNVPGALPIQAAFEVADWLHMLGDPLSYASHLRAGSTLFQFGVGDLEIPNPTESAVVRAAGAQANAWLFHFETAAALAPGLLGLTYSGVGFPILPHRILSNPTIIDPAQSAEVAIALAEQQQVANFLLGQGDQNPNDFLGTPFAGVQLFQNNPPLPETLGFLQFAP